MNIFIVKTQIGEFSTKSEFRIFAVMNRCNDRMVSETAKPQFYKFWYVLVLMKDTRCNRNITLTPVNLQFSYIWQYNTCICMRQWLLHR